MREGQLVKLIDAEGAGIPTDKCPNGTIMTLRDQSTCGKYGSNEEVPCWKGYYNDDKDYWWVDETRIEPFKDTK